jgi:hypothetical protein
VSTESTCTVKSFITLIVAPIVCSMTYHNVRNFCMIDNATGDGAAKRRTFRIVDIGHEHQKLIRGKIFFQCLKYKLESKEKKRKEKKRKERNCRWVKEVEYTFTKTFVPPYHRQWIGASGANHLCHFQPQSIVAAFKIHIK